jgi:hypothetical protein
VAAGFSRGNTKSTRSDKPTVAHVDEALAFLELMM